MSKSAAILRPGVNDAAAACAIEWLKFVDKAQIDRLRSWFRTHAETDDWEYRSVYASLLTNKLVVDNTSDGEDELFLARKCAQSEALDFWRDVGGDSWPDNPDAQWAFVEDFVRTAVTYSVDRLRH